MQSVINTIQNRMVSRKEDAYTVCTQHAQYSSISAAGPESYLWPTKNDPQWQEALVLAQQAADGTLEDITEGSTSYYAATMNPPPYWAADMRETVTIQGQIFFA